MQSRPEPSKGLLLLVLLLRPWGWNEAEDILLPGALRSPFAGCVDLQRDGRTPGRQFQGTAVGDTGTMQTSASMRPRGALCSVMPADTQSFACLDLSSGFEKAFACIICIPHSREMRFSLAACALQQAAASRKLLAGTWTPHGLQTTACSCHALNTPIRIS